MAKGVNIPLKIQGLREAREDLAKLNEEFEKVKDDPIESKKIAKEFNELSKAIDKTADELKEAQAAGELLGVKFDDLNEVIAGTTTEVLPLTSQIGEMEDRMYQLAAAGDTSSKEFKALQSETVRLRKVIIETDRSIDTMAENAGSIGGITSAFGELGESVLNLDFKRAGVALKGLGTQFKAFGATLLANPIFLIVAVVAAVVTAVVTLKDKVKFLGIAFDFVAGIIGDAVQALKDFLDLIGLTDFAAQEAAEAEKKRAEQALKSIEERGSAEQANFDRRIALASAEGKSTTDLEKQKQRAIIETNKLRAQELKTIAIQKQLLGEFNEEAQEEFKKAYTEILQSTKNAQNELKIIDANATKEYKEELKKRKEEHDKYLQDRLTAERLIQDLEIALMVDGREKMLLQNEVTMERLREDTLANETLTQEEKNQIVDLYTRQEAQNKLDILANNFEKELEIRNEHEEKIKELAVRRTNFIQSQASKDIKLEKDVKNAKYQIAKDGLNLISNLTELFGKKNEKAAKAAFAVDKAAKIASATAAGIEGAINAYKTAQGSPITTLFPAYPAIQAGLASAFAATNIAKIAQTKFGGGAQTASSAPTGGGFGGGGATSAAASTPSFELFGQPNDDNNVSAAASQETTQMTVKAVVVESDITSTQNKIEKMQKNAEL